MFAVNYVNLNYFMANWLTTSEMGFSFEDFCLNDLKEKRFPLSYKNEVKEDLSFYDIIIPKDNSHETITIECKFDKKAQQTNNICIEVGCNSRLSGLSISKANYWIISDGITIYLIDSKKIRECIADNNSIRYIKGSKVLQEDGIVKEMNIYLISKSTFEKYCIEIGKMDEMKYLNL